MTTGEIAIGALIMVAIVFVVTALLVNLALAATHLIEDWRKQRRAR